MVANKIGTLSLASAAKKWTGVLIVKLFIEQEASVVQVIRMTLQKLPGISLCPWPCVCLQDFLDVMWILITSLVK